MDTMNHIDRRCFVAGVGALAASLYLGGCRDRPIGGTQVSAVREPDDVEQIVDPATLEKPDLTIGYVPVNDCAPFAVAYTKGYFKKYGLRVRLSRESSWATSRDGVIFGRLDASPVVSGAVVNARLGAEGAMPARLCAAMTLQPPRQRHHDEPCDVGRGDAAPLRVRRGYRADGVGSSRLRPIHAGA